MNYQMSIYFMHLKLKYMYIHVNLYSLEAIAMVDASPFNIICPVDDKQDLLPGSIVGKGGHILTKEESPGSGSGGSNRNEESPLHKATLHSGKDV